MSIALTNNQSSMLCIERELSLSITPTRLPSGTAIKLLRKICHYAEKKNKLGEVIGWVRIKVETFGKWLDGVSYRHVQRLEAELEQLGYIERVTQPGKTTTIYPRVHSSQIPDWNSHTPVAAGPPTKPMLETVPSLRTPLPEGVRERSAPSKSSPPMSGVLSRVKSSRSSITIDKSEKQHAHVVEKQCANEMEAVLPPEAASVVATMHKCGVWRGKIATLVQTLGIETLTDAFSVTLRRIERGASDLPVDGCAGYALELARRVKSGEWKLPAWWLKEQGKSERTERVAEREQQAANRVAARPKAPIPDGWLPGVPEPAARELLRRAFNAIKNGTGFAPELHSTALRDQARVLWRTTYVGQTPPWATDEAS